MLTFEELKALKEYDWVWVVYHNKYGDEEFYSQINSCMSGNYVRNPVDINGVFLFMEDYGSKWVAYKNKEEAESKFKPLIPPCEIGTTIYLIRPCCCQCYYQTDYCHCKNQHKTKLTTDIVKEIVFREEGWYLNTEDSWGAFSDDYKKNWFFDLEEAKAKLVEESKE